MEDKRFKTGILNKTWFIFVVVAFLTFCGIIGFWYNNPYMPQPSSSLKLQGPKGSKNRTSVSKGAAAGFSDDRNQGIVKGPAAAEKEDSETEDKNKNSTRTLITYAYSETPNARENLLFFLHAGLHGAADFIFILNGPTDVGALIPRLPNVAVVERSNTCYDLGSHGEVLRRDDLWKRYRRFITLNASIRGPFTPFWSRECWSDAYLGRVTDKVKLVGMTANCYPAFHIQSMIWATDDVGMELMLFRRRWEETDNPGPENLIEGMSRPGVALQGCYNDRNAAIGAEVGATSAIRNAGYEVSALMAAFHKFGGKPPPSSTSSSSSSSSSSSASPTPTSSSGDDDSNSAHDETLEPLMSEKPQPGRNYWTDCLAGEGAGDVLFNGMYFGGNVHPYETVFMKANRDVDPTTLRLLTEWHREGSANDGDGGGSWNVCGS